MIANNRCALVLAVICSVWDGVAPGQTPADRTTAQQRAVKLFPDLADPNSKLNQEFLHRCSQYKVLRPAYFDDPEWPTQLAREIQQELGGPIAPQKELPPRQQMGAPFLEPEVAMPTHGTVKTPGRKPGKHGPPLEIVSPSGTCFFVKLLDSSGVEALSVFLVGGQKYKVALPEGIYTLKYAAGDRWYGYTYLFGPRTSYYQATRGLSFGNDGKHYTGFKITLYKALNGNLQTSTINASEF